MKILLRFFLVMMLVYSLVGCKLSSKEKAAANAKSNSVGLISHADNMNSFNEIINGSQPVLVDFYADWCAPCRMMAPILEQVATEMKGEVKILKVNVDKNREAAAKYGIQSIPTLMLFHNGEIKWQGVGVIQADQIKHVVASKSSL